MPWIRQQCKLMDFRRLAQFSLQSPDTEPTAVSTVIKESNLRLRDPAAVVIAYRRVQVAIAWIRLFTQTRCVKKTWHLTEVISLTYIWTKRGRQFRCNWRISSNQAMSTIRRRIQPETWHSPSSLPSQYPLKWEMQVLSQIWQWKTLGLLQVAPPRPALSTSPGSRWLVNFCQKLMLRVLWNRRTKCM